MLSYKIYLQSLSIKTWAKMSDLLLNPTLAILNTFISFYRYDLLAISFFKYTFSFMYLFISCQGTFDESQISNFDENLRREELLKFVHSIILVPKSNAQKSCSLCFLLCQAPPYILSKKLEIKRQKDTAWSPLAPKCVEISNILFGAASEHFWGKTILFHITSFLKFLIQVWNFHGGEICKHFLWLSYTSQGFHCFFSFSFLFFKCNFSFIHLGEKNYTWNDLL